MDHLSQNVKCVHFLVYFRLMLSVKNGSYRSTARKIFREAKPLKSPGIFKGRSTPARFVNDSDHTSQMHRYSDPLLAIHIHALRTVQYSDWSISASRPVRTKSTYSVLF